MTFPTGYANFYHSDQVAIQPVRFQNPYGTGIAGNLVLPQNRHGKAKVAMTRQNKILTLLLALASPAPKGLRQFQLEYHVQLKRRKTLPCSKGIETLVRQCCGGLYGVERPCPVSKGLKRFTNCINILKVTVERHRPAPKGLRL